MTAECSYVVLKVFPLFARALSRYCVLNGFKYVGVLILGCSGRLLGGC